jgi:dienelactone hydrolase
MPNLLRFLTVLTLALLVQYASAAERHTGPWDTARLQKAPAAEWGQKQGLLQEVYFTGEPLAGRPTRVFAYYAKPEGEGPFPAMVLLHGGGGKAFPEWATLWAKRGYAAIAIDLSGNGPDGKRLPDGSPNQDDNTKFGDFNDDQVRERWTYHAVANALLGHSLLAAQPEVDAERIGVTGISWGGYLTCIVAGVDERLKVAVPVYGCGFLHENSYWLPGRFEKMPEELRTRWIKFFDPSRYLAGVSCPILFVNGTNDFAYPLDSYQKSYNLVDEKLRNLCVTVRMPHGHVEGWKPEEIGLFVDSVLRDAKPLARLSAITVTDNRAMAKVSATVPLQSAQLHFTTDDGPWQQRNWQTIDATLATDQVTTELPAGERLVYFFTVRDERGAVTSSPHATR